MTRSIRAVTTSESIREQAGSGTEPSSSKGITFCEVRIKKDELRSR